ncbi:phage tail sheath family protein [Paracoccus tegillarcae]|uniref:Phage tail protein n=1 Tax=Paracoccus tegillarcae TaxID=1529068 RepID=A0A2K9EJJ5_9RHOB|nr:phage tail sheath C-terminal domain-containing protein [Paracoccus tegillarcae]AUH34559.1 phage tail protein [Paracoccus tegillarcae]
MSYKTPGVYIVERSAFPNSVVQVPTAVPAFIGHTETALNGSDTLRNIPTRITSLFEFQTYFGGPPKPVFKLTPFAPRLDEPPYQRGADTSLPAELPPAVFDVQEPDGPQSYELTQTNEGYALSAAMALFFANVGGACYVTSIGSYDEPIQPDAMLNALTRLEDEAEPTMVVIPETTRLSRDGSANVHQQMIRHCGAVMKSRMAILDIHGGYLPRDSPRGDPVACFRDDCGNRDLSYAAAYYPWLHSTVHDDSQFTYMNLEGESRAQLMTLLLGEVQGHQDRIDELLNIAPDILSEDQTAETTTTLSNTLRAIAPLYVKVLGCMARYMNSLPPAAAIAGAITSVDNSRGVWKAPANVSLASVAAPMVVIDSEQQQDLNVPISGKAVNAIRPFTGEGTLIWGARTLDGNSLDWRYINIRRMMIMIEESVRLAIEAYVFEPNDANTWVAVRSMIENFLSSLWRQGELQGAKLEDAFSVRVGLGQTMTSSDIIEGRMIVEIAAAPVRPAEFIVIRQSLQMQES